jgi:DNA-directed RNA polymerase subunit RPC12/RpoP
LETEKEFLRLKARVSVKNGSTLFKYRCLSCDKMEYLRKFAYFVEKEEVVAICSDCWSNIKDDKETW